MVDMLIYKADAQQDHIVYLWGGGWESRYFTFTFYIYILHFTLHFTEAVF